ncbi:MAG: ABC transporter substrate-binding protein, partial [Oscillospiraceae bacterium]|nr:ABC transporter substrate-binding protein [Oscillospiraceae bacterium]
MKMKRKLSFILACLMIASVASGCKSKQEINDETPGGNETPNAGKLTLSIVTTFHADSTERAPYEAAYREWERETGHGVSDHSAMADESFRKEVLAYFNNEDENENNINNKNNNNNNDNNNENQGSKSIPDVLYFYNGTHADDLVSGGKVVPISEIKAEFPGFAGDHELGLVPVSPADGIAYAVPMFGYWELMYANKKVLNDCGVAVPDENTEWTEFLTMCETIKEKGYVPIAVSVHEEPNSLFEYAVYNHSGTQNHARLPESAADAAGRAWTAGLADIKTLHTRGFLPSDTLTASHAEALKLLYEDKAAFTINGSWKLSDIELGAENPDDITVCFVPGTNTRKTSDIIAGLSQGWYITRNAWDDPERRAAAVSFVEKMIARETIASYGAEGLAMTLKGGTISPENP